MLTGLLTTHMYMLVKTHETICTHDLCMLLTKWLCPHPPNSFVEILIPIVMVGGGTLGR